MTDHLDWTHNVVDIPAAGLTCEREATESERQAIIGALGLLALNRLLARYRIEALAGGGYRLSGKISANVEQACVVTLEPVNAQDRRTPSTSNSGRISRPAIAKRTRACSRAPTLKHSSAALFRWGALYSRRLAASLDPYPRREGVEFKWQDPHADEPEKASPFAALSKLKDKG